LHGGETAADAEEAWHAPEPGLWMLDGVNGGVAGWITGLHRDETHLEPTYQVTGVLLRVVVTFLFLDQAQEAMEALLDAEDPADW
jgi:hypothetical protein